MKHQYQFIICTVAVTAVVVISYCLVTFLLWPKFGVLENYKWNINSRAINSTIKDQFIREHVASDHCVTNNSYHFCDITLYNGYLLLLIQNDTHELQVSTDYESREHLAEMLQKLFPINSTVLVYQSLLNPADIQLHPRDISLFMWWLVISVVVALLICTCLTVWFYNGYRKHRQMDDEERIQLLQQRSQFSIYNDSDTFIENSYEPDSI